MIRDLIRDLIRFLVSIAAPFVLVFGGAALVGLGLEYEVRFLLWAGGVVVICGVLWGLWLMLLAGSD